MCGISGLINVASDPKLSNRSAVERMIQLQRHRGPDGQGFWEDPELGVILGHARLAIIDLSNAANQPMFSPDGRYALVYNGEIYNYKELRTELLAADVTLHTQSDTEVLLAVFAKWGTAGLAKLNGMFAFAVWDRQERRLTLARDRWGIKPLYFAQYHDRFAFASEIKGLLSLPWVGLEIDDSAVRDFFLAAHVDHRHGRTFFRAVQQLVPGTYLEWQDGQVRQRRWYSLHARQQRSLTNDVVEEGRALLEDAVRIHLRSDVPVGGTLSGGLDSSTLTCVVDHLFANKWDRPYHVFISHFPGHPNDESEFAQAVLEHCHHLRAHWLEPRANELSDDLAKLFWHQEEPFGDTSIYAHYRLMELARQNGVKVLLTGQAGDEVFVGYPSFYRAFLGNLLRAGTLGRLAKEARARSVVAKEHLGGLLLAALYHALPVQPRRTAQRWRLRRLHTWIAPRLNDLAWAGEADTDGHSAFDAYLLEGVERFSLPHLLHHDDRNSMAFSIESRVPFLDPRLVEFAFRLRPEARLSDGFTKQAMRALAASWLPPKILHRPDKKAFLSPLGQWLRANAELVRDATENLLAEGRWLHPTNFRQQREDFLAERGQIPAQNIWRATAVALWQQHFIGAVQKQRCAS